MNCYYRNVNRLRRWQRFTNLVCLSSLVFLSSMPVIFLHKPLFPHFVDLSTYISHYFCYATSNQHVNEWLVNCILSFSQSTHVMFITYTKLKWLINYILSFSQSAHVMHATFTDYRPEWSSLRIAQIIPSDILRFPFYHVASG